MAVSSSTPTYLPGVGAAYQQQLAFNANQYNSMIQAYGNAAGVLSSSLPGIYSGYGALNANANKVASSEYTAATNSIQNSFQQANAQAQQNAINSGLGGSVGPLSGILAQNAGYAGQQYQSAAAGIYGQEQQNLIQVGLAQQQAELQGQGMLAGVYQNEAGGIGSFKQPSIPNMYGQSSYANSGGGYGSGSSSGGYNTGPSAMAQGQADANQAFNQANSYGYAGAYNPGGVGQMNWGQTLNLSDNGPWQPYMSSDAMAQGGSDYFGD